MKNQAILALFLLFPLLASGIENEVYVVYLGEHKKGEKALHEIEDYHHSYLHSVKETQEDARASLLYSYKHSINGFAAVLTPDEASKLSGLEEVISVIKSHPRKHTLHTTRSWEFSGLEERAMQSNNGFDEGQGFLTKARYGEDVIVGVLDSGVWPESRSFHDQGMGPIPTSWKGICQRGPGFNSSHCNRVCICSMFLTAVKFGIHDSCRKLIGARYYLKAYELDNGPVNTTLDDRSPRDRDGHGTHTASTVGGRRIATASAIGGFAYGLASGGAPMVRLAIYKACWAIPGHDKADGNTCYEPDMLAAIDDAIADGVNVLSISIGTKKSIEYKDDGLAIGAFHATKNNIVVACSAGNFGPGPSTLANTAPWIITVGASSVDRSFVAPVVLGNGMIIQGQTITPHKLEGYHQLVYAGDVVKPDVSENYIAGQCLPGSLSPDKTKGKIVLCFRGNGTRVGKGMEVQRAGGVGFIIGNNKDYGAEVTVDPHVFPATAVTFRDALKILEYINSTRYPMAMIKFAETVLHTKPAPIIAAFSSRGPNANDPHILKPDITAAGVNILAAWSEGSSPTKLNIDQRRVKYNIFSGTSMSCPHVAAAAALIKSIHPSWSSAAIRSALMTTAGLTNNVGLPLHDESGTPATPFAFGSGHFRPAMAADPGLVYDASYNDYLLYCCSLGVILWNPKEFKCPKELPPTYNLNYPSLAVPRINDTIIVTRTVTNVGRPGSVYTSTVKPPLGFLVKITPSMLAFDHVGQKKSFTITIKASKEAASSVHKDEYAFGWYTWTDGFYIVRSPMAVS